MLQRTSGLAQSIGAMMALAAHHHLPLTWYRSLRGMSTGANPMLEGAVTACLDSSRALVRLEGAQTIQFLQGLVTNDVRPLETPGAAPVYAALLTPKGKFLHDLIFYREPDGALLMEVDREGRQRAIDWLTRYKMRKQVQVHDVSDGRAVWAQFGAKAPSQQQGWWPDPRLPALGLRTVQLHASTALHGGDMSGSTQGNGGAEAGQAQAAYHTWRHMHGVAEGEVEIPTEKTAPLDYNLDALQGVSYKKGCYIGQERNSFTHFRGLIRKRCMPFRFDQDGPLPAQGETIVSGNGVSAGTVQGVSAGYGLLYVRLKTALAAAEGRVELRGKLSKAHIRPFRPEWWPDTWGHEEGADQGDDS